MIPVWHAKQPQSPTNTVAQLDHRTFPPHHSALAADPKLVSSGSALWVGRRVEHRRGSGSYWILTRLIPVFFNNHVLAKAISYTLGVINSYLWNRSFTFRSQCAHQRVVLFFMINLLAVGINSGMMAIALNVFHSPEWVGLVIATVVTMTFNFISSKFVVFRLPVVQS